MPTVAFEFDARRHLALNAGPEAAPNMAASFVVACADQAEIDRCWEAFCEGASPAAAAG